jgi:hypothetical protein
MIDNPILSLSLQKDKTNGEYGGKLVEVVGFEEELTSLDSWIRHNIRYGYLVILEREGMEEELDRRRVEIHVIDNVDQYDVAAV